MKVNGIPVHSQSLFSNNWKTGIINDTHQLHCNNLTGQYLEPCTPWSKKYIWVVARSLSCV